MAVNDRISEATDARAGGKDRSAREPARERNSTAAEAEQSGGSQSGFSGSESEKQSGLPPLLLIDGNYYFGREQWKPTPTSGSSKPVP